MSTLVLIRHGQATPFQRESDKLSSLGEQQATAVGEYLVSTGERVDAVFTGTLARQTATEAAVARVFAAHGVDWPSSQATAGWNEYDAPGVLSVLVPALAARDERFASLVKEFEEARGTPQQNRYFQRMFEIAMVLWLDGSVDVEGVEPFHAFEHRVSTSLAAIQGVAGSRRVAVFTSGGPIGLVMQRVLKAPSRTFLDVNWRVRNTSITEFVYGDGRISLDSFNSVAHLPVDLRSFR